MKELIKVLNDGFVSLEYMAPAIDPELQIVNSARVSFNRRKKVIDKSDEGLIRFLLKNRHGTPFEMVEFCFHVRVPIFVAREWHRHRIFSYNEMSGRYVKLEPNFYVPECKAIRKQVGKPGNYRFLPIGDSAMEHKVQQTLRGFYREAERTYSLLLDSGVAKELARVCLPVAIYTEFYAKTNLRSWLNFLSLRNAPNAMLEIQEYAKAIELIIKERVPNVIKAFEDAGRVAP